MVAEECSTAVPTSSRRGAIAKRLCTGLQIRVGRFDSGSRLQDSAGVAQLVERNLAKVEVASSRLVSRSSQKRESQSAFPFLLLGLVIIAVASPDGEIGRHKRLKISRP